METIKYLSTDYRWLLIRNKNPYEMEETVTPPLSFRIGEPLTQENIAYLEPQNQTRSQAP